MSIFDLIKEVVDELNNVSESDYAPQPEAKNNRRINLTPRRNIQNYPGNGGNTAAKDFDRVDLHRGSGMECKFAANADSHQASDEIPPMPSQANSPTPQPNKIIEILRRNAADAVVISEILSKPVALRNKK